MSDSAVEVERLTKINKELVRDFNTLLIAGARQDDRIRKLEEAAQAMLDDYMTSETHHPDYVLVPTTAFEKICAAIGAGAGK